MAWTSITGAARSVHSVSADSPANGSCATAALQRDTALSDRRAQQVKRTVPQVHAFDIKVDIAELAADLDRHQTGGFELVDRAAHAHRTVVKAVRQCAGRRIGKAFLCDGEHQNLCRRAQAARHPEIQ